MYNKILNLEDFMLNEARIQYKRRYTENHPAKSFNSNTKIRTKVLERMKGKIITEDNLKEILTEIGASRAWFRKNKNLFEISENGISLSKTGKRMANHIVMPLNEADPEFTPDSINDVIQYVITNYKSITGSTEIKKDIDTKEISKIEKFLRKHEIKPDDFWSKWLEEVDESYQIYDINEALNEYKQKNKTKMKINENRKYVPTMKQFLNESRLNEAVVFEDEDREYVINDTDSSNSSEFKKIFKMGDEFKNMNQIDKSAKNFAKWAIGKDSDNESDELGDAYISVDFLEYTDKDTSGSAYNKVAGVIDGLDNGVFADDMLDNETSDPDLAHKALVILGVEFYNKFGYFNGAVLAELFSVYFDASLKGKRIWN